MHRIPNDRIVITGMGTVNPLGLSVQAAWENALNGVSGAGPITLFDASEYLVQAACEVKNFNPDDFMPAREARRRDRYQQFAAAAAAEAIRQASLEVTAANAGRVGVVVSSSTGGIGSLQDGILTMAESGPRRVSPFLIPMLMSNGAAGMISIDYGFQGPSFSVASACASGSDGIGMAWMLIRAGVMDAAVVGASEATISRVGMAAFDRMGAMSRRNNSSAPQPFDLNRDGLVMGEGAAVLMLERESHARQRGAVILAELAGYASTTDAYHITAPNESGQGGAQALRQALDSAGVLPSEVDYINAHGTATPLNDASETNAIKTAFGEQAYHIPVSSTKSMTGHMMGATGALELIFCVKAIQEGRIPPTINYQTPDPRCDLDVVPNTARELQVRVTVSNAFGFGGHNSVLVARRYEV